MDWQEKEAKDRFSELIDSALTSGPQTIHRTAETRLVLVSAEHYASLQTSKGSFVDDLLEGPCWDDTMVELTDRREREPSRKIPV